MPTNKVFSPSLAQAKVMKRLEEMSSQIDRIADVQKKIMQRLNVLLRCAQDARAETNHAGELEQLKNILFNGAVVQNQIHTDKHGNYKIYTRICKEYGDFDHCQQPNACPYVQPRSNTAIRLLSLQAIIILAAVIPIQVAIIIIVWFTATLTTKALAVQYLNLTKVNTYE